MNSFYHTHLRSFNLTMMQMLVHQMLIFILLLSICRESSAALQMAMGDCQSSCGDVIISYPFGIGPNRSCYYDEWFEIDCNVTTDWKPLLRRAKLEVLNISIDGTLQVNSPVTFFCEGKNRTQKVVADLKESPFVYSQRDNIFTARTCDSFAFVSSADFLFGGCRSACDESYGYLSCDVGTNCCQISIPRDLTVINANLSEATTNCTKFAFLSDRRWFEDNTYSTSSSEFTAAMMSARKVPVVLDWSINSDTKLFDSFKWNTLNEFILNGTLSEYIHHHNEEFPDFPLKWEMRLRVSMEVAGAISYLHSSASMPIYHSDIKSSNILLDDKYRAKEADFGTSRSIAIDKTHLTTRVQGTFGYLDPEYFQSSQFTDKSDVYSFGVVLAELLTGQKPTSPVSSEEWRSLANHFILSMEGNCLFDILDSRVRRDGREEEIVAVANLARRCLNMNGRKRPTMKEVAVELEGIQLSVKAHSDVPQNFLWIWSD